MKYKEILLIPTPFTLKVFYGSKDAISKRVKKDFKGYEIGNIFDKYGGFVDRVEADGYPIIIMCLLEGSFTPGIIAHESEHVIYYKNELIGNKYNYESQEMHAYYIQWLVDEIWKMK